MDDKVESCPKCNSKDIDTTYDEITQELLYLVCNNCLYIEVTNQHPEIDTTKDETFPWQTDPDAWKSYEDEDFRD